MNLSQSLPASLGLQRENSDITAQRAAVPCSPACFPCLESSWWTYYAPFVVSRLATLVVTALVGVCVPVRASAQGSPESIQVMVREVAAGYADRALAAERAGRELEAEVLFLRAAETDPGLMPAWLGYARSLGARQHRDEAVEVLSHVPAQAMVTDDDRVALARGFAALGQPGHALTVLRGQEGSATAMRAMADIAAADGRFSEALAAARRVMELTVESTNERNARVLVHALERLVAEADAVHTALPPVNTLRRWLAAE